MNIEEGSVGRPCDFTSRMLLLYAALPLSLNKYKYTLNERLKAKKKRNNVQKSLCN